RLMQEPMCNTIYADSDGNIFFFYAGLVPKKSGGSFDFWTRPVPGDTKGTLWTDFLGYDDLPKALNPKAGWVQNSNSVPWFMIQPVLDWHKYPPYMADPLGWPSFREQRGIRMLAQNEKISYDQLIADKYSTRSELADHVLDDLIAAAKTRGGETLLRACDVLAKWDRNMEADSHGAVLFETWANKAFASEWPLSVPFDSAHFLETPRGFTYPGRDTQFLEDGAKEVFSKYGKMDIAWGDVHRFRRGKFDFPGNGGSPGLGIFRSIWYEMEKDGKFVASGGDSYIAAVEFSKPLKANVLLAYGNSSDPDSPHYGDQLELGAKKKLRPAWYYRKDVETHTVDRSVVP
ncbi:MAG TPA: penicillin acylase family protein, partial [bacterium]